MSDEGARVGGPGTRAGVPARFEAEGFPASGRGGHHERSEGSRWAAVGGQRPITFSFDDALVSAYEGDSIAAALFAAGVRIFSRSFKYHRPRGLLCCAGRCPNCLMNVDGTPNVRTCVTPVRDGMRVRHQNAWPTLERDLLSVVSLADRFLPVGFYYKTFIHPRPLWPAYERVLRAFAGIGTVDRQGHAQTYHHEYRATDVAVVGGGPAGMAAALAAARAGRRVTLIDEQEALGGMLRADRRTRVAEGEFAGRSGAEVAATLAEALETEGVAVWTGAVAFGAYEGRQLGVQRDNTLIELRYERLILATGAFERPAVFPGNDLPGIMLGTGAQRLLRLYGVRPGRRAVVATSHDGGLELAEELIEAGVEVAVVVDTRSSDEGGGEADGRPGTTGNREGVAERLVRSGVTIYRGAEVGRAHGHRHLSDVVIILREDLARLFRSVASLPQEDVTREQSRSIASSIKRFPCDLLCLSLGWEPATALLAHGIGYDQEAIAIVGAAAGATALEECLAQGEAIGRPKSEVGTSPPPLRPLDPSPSRPVVSSIICSPGDVSLHPHCFVCLCEDVTDKDIVQAIGEGFDHVETLKRYSTASMGPCQGKMCRAAVGALCAHYTERAPEEVGVSRARPPAHPVTLGALGAAHAAPVRVTPMHHRHASLGARFTNLGEWKRPEVYTAVEEECRAVRERVGLIDVGTLGKLEVVGRDAAGLLDKVYTNRCSDLSAGRVRYAVVCDDAGIILDDGTITRLDEERWFLTTTSGGVETMEQWFRWWAVPGAGGELPCVHVVNVTAARAAMNLAGPRSREVLARLTDLDLSPRSFPYLAAREGIVAGVPALLLRIGFVGELGYEIHLAAEYGLHVWDALMEAGREFGILPFGVEAQRVLRLEKQHLIVGHDTDALSNPLDAGMPWVVRWEKSDFVGRPSLLRVRAAAGVEAESERQRLVGFTQRDGSIFMPEGCQVVAEGRSVGRVTSYRRSPTLGYGIGIAWVPEEAAREGAHIEVATPAGAIPATVTLRPFYDPEGQRVRNGGGPPALRATPPPLTPAGQEVLMVARGSLHDWHLTHGARMEERDGWLVPADYGSVSEEVAAARSNVALAESVGLGVLDLMGRELALIAERLGVTDLPVGQAADLSAGGALARWCRLTRDHARLLFDRGGPARDQFLTHHSSLITHHCLHAIDVSSGLTTLRVVGPRSPDLLARLIRVDLDPRVFGNRRLALTGASGVPLQVLRWDRGSLVAYELTLGRDVAEYFVDLLVHAGEDLDLRLIGEAGEALMSDE